MHLTGLLAFILLSQAATGAPMTRSKPRTLTVPIHSIHRSPDNAGDPHTVYREAVRNAQRRYKRILGVLPSQSPEVNKRYNAPLDKLEDFNAAIQQRPKVTNLDAASLNGSNAGVSPLDIQAAINGGITEPTMAVASNSIGLGILGSDLGYVAIVEIGTPPRPFQMLMDSGSADFWVGSESCQAEGGGGCGNHQFLGPQSSSSFFGSQQSFNVMYGSGNVIGNMVEDNVVLGGLSLPRHSFGVANIESSGLTQAKFDGIMGLAQSGLSQQKLPTPVESLASAGLIEEAIVAFKIPRLADGKNDGEITFGGLDPRKFQNDTLVQVPNVNQNGFWEVNLDAVSVNGQDLGFQNQTAILDTGTTLFLAPPEVVSAIHAQIPGASLTTSGFTVPCTTNASVALTVGNRTFAINPHDVAFLPVDPNQPDGTCTSGIVTSGSQANQWIVGDVFLKNVYFGTNVNDNIIYLAGLA